MSIFTINFWDKVLELFPPDKRQPKMIKWLYSLVAPIQQYNNTKVFIDYKNGSTYYQWLPYMTYFINDRVIYKGQVFECTLNGNTLEPPNNWVLYLPTFIANDERFKFSSQKLLLEYAINLRFSTDFRQPPLVSDIWISLVTPIPFGFITGETEPYSESVGETISSGTVGSVVTFIQENNFVLNVPTGFFTNVTEAEIRSFANNIVPQGINYTIIEY